MSHIFPTPFRPHTPLFSENQELKFDLPNRNSNFVERVTELAELEEVFRGDPSKKSAEATLYGPRGMGKSTIAIEYAHREDKYTFKAWLDAEQSLVKGLIKLGQKLGIVNERTTKIEALVNTKEYLEKHPGWLLILAHAEDLDLLTYLPKKGGHLLITSSLPVFDHPIEMEAFGAANALELFKKITNLGEPHKAERFFRKISDSPFAVVLMGAFVNQTKVSVSDYEVCFDEERQTLLGLQESVDDYNSSVAASLNVSLKQLKETFPESLSALYRSLFLSPKNIPLKLLDSKLSSVAIATLIGPLKDYALLTLGTEEDTVSIHPFIQNSLKEKLSNKETKEALKALIDTFEDDIEIRFDRLQNQGTAYREQGELLKAIEVFKAIVTLHEKRSGPESEDVLEARYALSAAYLEAFALDEALECRQKELELTKILHPNDSVAIAYAIGMLGHVKRLAGNFSDALVLYTESLLMIETSSGKESKDFAIYQNLIGRTLLAEGKIEESLPFLHEAFRVILEMKKNDKWLAYILRDLGEAHLNQGAFSDGMAYLSKALKSIQKVRLENDVEMGHILVKNGMGQRLQEDLAEAREMLDKALIIFLERYGSQHPFVANAFFEIALLERAEGKRESSDAILLNVLEMQRMFFQDDHPDIIKTQKALGEE